MFINRGQGGFTLLEVLIAIFVLAIGLLGLGGVLTIGLKNDQSAYYRSQATMLAYDILDVMRANREAARGGDYNLALDAAAPTGDSRAQLDLNHWIVQQLEMRLPQADGAVNVANDRVTIVIQWDDSRGAQAAQQFVVESQL
jgi:type IV pilus assembly protein PilV